MRPEEQILPHILEIYLSSIQALCHKHKVKRLWAFGSILTDDFREDSDVDLLYEWDRPNIRDEDYLDNLDGLLDALKDLFGRKIDFVHYPSLKNPYFQEEIE